MVARFLARRKARKLVENTPKPIRLEGERRGLAYVVYSSFPYLTTGYAVRTHALSRAIRDAGLPIHCITRPGFPWDESDTVLWQTKPSLEAFDETIDGITYKRLPEPQMNHWGHYSAYIASATEQLIQEFSQTKPECVMAASNHISALPALHAARALGLPFSYDMRGMWELSRSAREPAFRHSVQFEFEKAVETHLARAADHVFVLSPAMERALTARGVGAEQITYLPNGCDMRVMPTPNKIDQTRRRLMISGETTVIGYAGSFPAYEGLEDLIEAAAILHSKGADFRIVLIGDEAGTGAHSVPMGQLLEQKAAALGVADRILLTGRLSHKEARSLSSIFDIAVVPRRHTEVTDMVAPLKPAESMAAGKALLVSDALGMEGLVEHGRTGLVFKAGDAADMANKLRRMITNPGLRERLGKAAKKEAFDRFQWRVIGQGFVRHLRKTVELSDV